MEINKKISLSLAIVIICFIIDRLSKIYIIDLFSQSNVNDNIYINPYLNFILLWNKGIAFGLLQSEQIFYHLISGIILTVILFLIFIIYRAQKKWEIIYFSIIVGGAIGNFIDRIYYMAVPDFIDFHYKEFHWFTFNIADIFITTGIICILFYEIFKKQA